VADEIDGLRERSRSGKARHKTAATARTLRGAEYIFISARTYNSPQSVLDGSLPDGRQPEAAQETVEPRSGTKGKDEVRRAKPPQTFLE